MPWTLEVTRISRGARSERRAGHTCTGNSLIPRPPSLPACIVKLIASPLARHSVAPLQAQWGIPPGQATAGTTLAAAMRPVETWARALQVTTRVEAVTNVSVVLDDARRAGAAHQRAQKSSAATWRRAESRDTAWTAISRAAAEESAGTFFTAGSGWRPLLRRWSALGRRRGC